MESQSKEILDWKSFQAEAKSKAKFEATRCLHEGGNVGSIFVHLGNHEYLDFVIENRKLFLLRGIYEEGLWEALTMVNLAMINTPYSTDFLLSLLDDADKDKLRACGCPLPYDSSFRVFRGVIDSRDEQSISRVFWTINKNTAAWFASGEERGDSVSGNVPAVYSLDIKPEHIFFYNDSRDEEEVVVDVRKCDKPRRMTIMPKAIKPG